MNDNPCGYDLNALSRFINTVLFNRKSDDQGWLLHAKRCREEWGLPEQTVTTDMIAAAFALRDALHGVDLCKKYKLHLRPSKVDLRKTIHHPATSIVRAHLNGEITRDKAFSEISKLLEIGEKKSEEFYYEVREGQQTTLDSLKRIFAIAGWAYGELPEPANEEKAEMVLRDINLTTFKKAKRIQEILGISYPDALKYIKDHKR